LWINWNFGNVVRSFLIEKVALKFRSEIHNHMTNFGRYVVCKRTHEESSSRLWLARESQTNTPVLIKEWQPGNTQVMNEIRILSRVQHRYIIPAMEVIDTPTGVAIVFPFAWGGDLLERISIHPVSESESKVILRKILKALEHMHAQKIWHRDIKPDNILIMSADATDVLLTDFGLALCAPFGVCSDNWPGTKEYMAPEMLKNEPYTSAVDIWALGVVFYTMMTSWMPFDFEGRDPVRVVELRLPRLLHDRRLKTLSLEGRDLLEKMLQYRSIDRISASEALQHRWFDAA
jgi:calcium/calmodulin-dependent protein kinase I